MDYVYVKFIQHNFNVLHSHHVCNCWHTNNGMEEEEVTWSKIWQVNVCSMNTIDFFNKNSLLGSELLGHYSSTNFLHPQIFNRNQSYSLSTDLQFFCNHSDSKPLIIPCQSSQLFDIFIWIWCQMSRSAVKLNSSLLSENYLCHSKTCALDIMSSPCTHFNISNILVEFLQSLNKNFMLILC